MDEAEIISNDLSELLEGLCVRHLQHLTDLQMQFESGEASRYPSEAIKDSSNIITAAMKLLEKAPSTETPTEALNSPLGRLFQSHMQEGEIDDES